MDRLSSRPLALLLGVVCLTAVAQPRLPPGVRGPDHATATRSVSTYLGLERQLAEAEQRCREADVTAMLDAGFAVRSSAGPDPSARDAWVASCVATGTPSRVRDLSVVEVDDLAIVTFLLDRPPARGRAKTDFVVDVWRSSSHRLLSRSITDTRGASRAPARPDGRE